MIRSPILVAVGRRAGYVMGPLSDPYILIWKKTTFLPISKHFGNFFSTALMLRSKLNIRTVQETKRLIQVEINWNEKVVVLCIRFKLVVA